MLKLEGATAEGLEGSLGSAGDGLAAWLAGASVSEDGELASIAGTATTVFHAFDLHRSKKCSCLRQAQCSHQ